MATSIEYKKYSVEDSQGSLVFQTDFSSAVTVEQNSQGIFFHDLINFTEIQQANFAYTSILQLSLTTEGKSEDLEIIKNSQEGKFEIFLNKSPLSTDVYAFLTERLGIQLDQNSLRQNLIDLTSPQFNTQQALENHLNNVVKQDSDTLPDNLNPEQKRKVERYKDVKNKIDRIEKVVDNYQNNRKSKEDSKSKIESLEKEIKKVDDKLGSVQSLLPAREKIIQDLQRFGEIAQDPNLKEKVENLKQSRLDKIVQFFHQIKNQIQNAVSHIPIDKERAGFIQAKILLPFLFLQATITLILYLMTKYDRVLMFGFGIFLLIFILLLILNLVKDSPRGRMELGLQGGNLKYPEIYSQVANKDEDNFFVNAAWVGALKRELESVEKSIKNQLGEQSLEDLQSLKQQKEAELNQLKEGEEGESTELTPEEYLKKRRELDMLKIERDNLDNFVKSLNLPTTFFEEKQDLANMPLIFKGINQVDKVMGNFIDNFNFSGQKIIINV